MKSKNKRPMNPMEREYVIDVKRLDCMVCRTPGPSEAHEPEQGLWFCSIPLCPECHRGPNGWHGDRERWRSHKMTELKAINETHRRVEELRNSGMVRHPGRNLISVPAPKRSSSTARPSKIIERT
jgi:hypothetical protein